jgi:deoxyribose-phosphate aldolase
MLRTWVKKSSLYFIGLLIYRFAQFGTSGYEIIEKTRVANCLMPSSIDLKDLDLATYIDHTLLDPTATPEAIVALCDGADRHHFAAVCVAPSYVALAVERLYHKRPQVCTVIGFPTGAHTAAVKLLEAQLAVEQGATELDVVINLGWLKAGKADELHREIAEIVATTGVTVKAILEMTVLTAEEKRLAAEICLDAGVAWLKTSTGWQGGATVADVELLQSITRGRIGIKASGGIRTLEQALALITAGATRLGTSRGVALIRERES